MVAEGGIQEGVEDLVKGGQDIEGGNIEGVPPCGGFVQDGAEGGGDVGGVVSGFKAVGAGVIGAAVGAVEVFP